MVDQVLAQENDDRSVYWALADNQGSIRYVLDNQGNIINEITYNAFGRITNESNPAVDFRFGYTGREFDEETGLYYYRSRYYDATVGRFVSEDAIGFEGGDSNLYRYVGNSPLNYTDPYGEDLYSVLDKADEFFAGFGDAVTFGGTTALRKKLYGDLATQNHEGGFFISGQLTGAVTSFALGFNTPADEVWTGLNWAQRFAQGYDVVGTGVDAYQSTTNFMNGCGSALNLLNFAPLIGFGVGQLNKLNRLNNRIKIKNISIQLDLFDDFHFKNLTTDLADNKTGVNKLKTGKLIRKMGRSDIGQLVLNKAFNDEINLDVSDLDFVEEGLMGVSRYNYAL
jgi:RHS repeat-associated protein